MSVRERERERERETERESERKTLREGRTARGGAGAEEATSERAMLHACTGAEAERSAVCDLR